MLHNFVEDIQKEIERLKTEKEVVEYLREQEQYLLEVREGLLDAARNTAETSSPLTFVQERAADILWQEARKAIEVTEEFDHPVFSSKLEEAILNPKTITLGLEDGKLVVKINLAETAGTVNDYINAIKETRSELWEERLKKPKQAGAVPLPPDLAASMWEEKYYSPARRGTVVFSAYDKRSKKRRKKKKKAKLVSSMKYIANYWHTIYLRISKFRGLAPFWEIIDQGPQILGGNMHYSFPHYRGQKFVQKATMRIIRLYNSQKAKVKQSNNDFSQSLRAIDEKIAYINAVTKAGSSRVKEIENVVVPVLEARLKSKFPFADPVRLKQLMLDIANQVPLGERYNLTAPGGPRVRPRTKTLLDIVNAH